MSRERQPGHSLSPRRDHFAVHNGRLGGAAGLKISNAKVFRLFHSVKIR